MIMQTNPWLIIGVMGIIWVFLWRRYHLYLNCPGCNRAGMKEHTLNTIRKEKVLTCCWCHRAYGKDYVIRMNW